MARVHWLALFKASWSRSDGIQGLVVSTRPMAFMVFKVLWSLSDGIQSCGGQKTT